MRPLRSFSFLFLVFLLSSSETSSRASEETKTRPRPAERELEHLRESLHEAQRELADKSDRIVELERELAASKSRQKHAGKVEVESTNTKPKTGQEKTRKMASKGSEKRDPDKKTAPAAPATFDVSYERKSAVNYEGREAALSWAREQLRKTPEARLKISGTANDSEYAEVNQEVAENRARYLGDFLVLSGIPQEAIVSTEGCPAKADGEQGRSARLEVVGGSGRSEGTRSKKSR